MKKLQQVRVYWNLRPLWKFLDQESKAHHSRLSVLSVLSILCVVALTGCSVPRSHIRSVNLDHVVIIDTRTPPGLRAQQVFDMLNSDWPIGPVGVRTLTEPDIVDSTVTTMETLWWDRPFQLDHADVGATTATLYLRTPYGARQNIELHVDSSTFVSKFDVQTLTPSLQSWDDLNTLLSRSGAQYSYQISRIVQNRCQPITGANTTVALPLASIFKLYVLLAVAQAIEQGHLTWNDLLTVTDRSKAVGSQDFYNLPIGAHISVYHAAEKMISASDNMATDLLINRVGTHAIEQALRTAGHHDPDSMTPFPTMYELFSIGWGTPDVREQWQHANAQQRAQLLHEVNTHIYHPDPTRAHIPASLYQAEWYGTSEDICKVHLALQQHAYGINARLKEILSNVRGIELDPHIWPYVAAKAGGLPGDLTFSWYAIDRYHQPWVVSFQLNWPRDYGKNASKWFLKVAQQAFKLIPISP